MLNIEDEGDAIEPVEDKDSNELTFSDSSFEEGYEESVVYNDEPECTHVVLKRECIRVRRE